MILQKLREEGLISRTTQEKTSGVSFDIVDVNTSSKLPALPPLKLAKLEKRRRKKRPLTDEEIQEKLQRAEQRRKVSYSVLTGLILTLIGCTADKICLDV